MGDAVSNTAPGLLELAKDTRDVITCLENITAQKSLVPFKISTLFASGLFRTLLVWMVPAI